MVKATTSAALDKLLKRAEKVSVNDLAVNGGSKKNTPPEVTELVATILATGIRARAGTIHIEARSDGVHVRHRIDGVLTEAQLLPHAVGPVLVAGLKILVRVFVDEVKGLPQQGTTIVTVADKLYGIRVATLPVDGGERAVVQLTSLSERAPTLYEMDFWGPSLKALSEAITKTHGLVLLAGPHDAGQAEVAYSILSHLASPKVSIATIEDPITYRIPGVMQTQVNSRIGLSFAMGLRTLLKQDANVLHVSNVRDSETAKLTVEAALSGRLVLAGLHAQNTSGTISQLLSSGIEPYLVAHTVQAIIGQRVVRRLCENCKQIYSPPEQEMIGILKSLGIKTAAQLQRIRELEQQALEEKVVVGASPTNEQNSSFTHLYRPNKDGCTQCNHTGYKGSVGIYEALSVNETIQRLITGSATNNVIENQAAADGMPTLAMDGLVKVLLGLTGVDEVVGAVEA